MYLLKNFRNYIPVAILLTVMIILEFFLKHINNGLGFVLEVLVIILPFGVVPLSNVICVILNTRKFKSGAKMYVSILFSFVLQLLLILTQLIGIDFKGMGIFTAYLIFILTVDAISLTYPYIIYPSTRKD